MIATSRALSHWLRHISGQSKLPMVKRPLLEAIELNQRGAEIVSTFGTARFQAMIGFVDMRGFSGRATGRPPEEVRNIAEPFVAGVVVAAQENDCLIDKTIGDEVMLIMPSIGYDVALGDIGLRVRDPWAIALSGLIADLLRAFENSECRYIFSAGFAFGDVVLGRVGTEDYGEWTAYGNVVNAAKRLQEFAAKSAPTASGKETNRFVVGSIENEWGTWFSSEFNLDFWQQVGPILLEDPKCGVLQCKGVGKVSYVSAEPRLR